MDKIDMKELVKNAPAWAMYYRVGQLSYYKIDHNDVQFFVRDKGEWIDLLVSYHQIASTGEFIKLDYSVNDEKPALQTPHGDGIHDDTEILQSYINAGKAIPNEGVNGSTFRLSKPLTFGAVADEKPVYTKAMCDTGELPPVGCVCEAKINAGWFDVTIDYIGIRVIVYTTNKGKQYGVRISDVVFTPTRTKQEKLIDEIAQELSNSKAETTDVVTDYSMFKSDAEWLLSKFKMEKLA